jgi:hypothetical protein
VCNPHRRFEYEGVKAWCTKAESEWANRYAELVLSSKKELATVLAGFKAEEVDTAGIDYNVMDQPQRSTDKDWIYQAKWAWARVHDEIKLAFSIQLGDAAVTGASETLMAKMVEIYFDKYAHPSKDDIETKILDEQVARENLLAEKSAAAASGATRQKRSRQNADANIEQIKTKARADAVKQVNTEMTALKAKVTEYDTMKANLEKAETDLATEKSEKETAQAKMRSAVLSRSSPR